MDNQTEVKQLLQSHMAASRLTYKQVAEKMGYSSTGVYNVVKYEKNVSTHFIGNFARALNLTTFQIDELLNAIGAEKLEPKTKGKPGPKKGSKNQKVNSNFNTTLADDVLSQLLYAWKTESITNEKLDIIKRLLD